MSSTTSSEYWKLAAILLACNFVFISFIQAQPKSDSLYKQYRIAFNECEEYLRKGKIDRCIICYEQLTKQFPTQVKSHVRLAEINYQKRDLHQTLLHANRAIDLNANDAYAPMAYLSNKMKSNNHDELAIQLLNRLSVSELDTIKLQKVEKKRLDMHVNQTYDNTPIPGVTLVALGDSINTKDDEYFPSLSLDEDRLIFTRKLNGANEDFFISKKDSSGKWSKATNMGSPPNTGMPDGAATLSTDGNYLFYTRCDMRSPNGIEGGGCDVVFSYREVDGWSSPQYFGYTINTTGYEGQPCLSSNNEDLYFVSNREGGFGGLDIWVSKYIDHYWTKPINLGPSINTPGNETAPFIHPDNESLYFVSDRHPGLGFTDIFLSRKNKNGTWKKPINLGAPINSEKYESSITINARGTQGFIAANKNESKGGMDIYTFDLHPAITPVPTLCLKGYLIDKFYKNKLYDKNIDFTYLYNGLKMGNVKSNDGDASYSKALQMGKKYLIKIQEPNYRAFYKTIDLTSDTLPNNLWINLKLKQIGLVDTLYRTTLKLKSDTLSLDSLVNIELDTTLTKWKYWIEDSANIVVFLKGYYYCGDSISDSLFQSRLNDCKHKLKFIANKFESLGLKCEFIMQDLDMLIFKEEDEDIYNEIELKIIEYY